MCFPLFHCHPSLSPFLTSPPLVPPSLPKLVLFPLTLYSNLVVFILHLIPPFFLFPLSSSIVPSPPLLLDQVWFILFAWNVLNELSRPKWHPLQACDSPKDPVDATFCYFSSISNLFCMGLLKVWKKKNRVGELKLHSRLILHHRQT